MTQIITTEEAKNRYEESLNECHGEIFNMPAATVLFRADPTAYRCGFNDFVSSLASDEIYVRGLTAEG